MGGIGTKVLIVFVSIGISIFFIAYIMFLRKLLSHKRFEVKFNELSKKIFRSRRKTNIKRKLKIVSNRIIQLVMEEKVIVILVIFLTLGLSTSLREIYTNLIIGIILALIIVWIFQKLKKNIIKTKKVKEVVSLFDGIEIYTKAGYSLVQSLRASKLLTNLITPAIDKCLSYWSVGPQKALEILKDEINLEETDSIILLLMHLESTGTKNLQGLLRRDASNIERLQNMKTELKIAHRPLILVVYKILPMASFLGIIIGTLIYRVFITFEKIGIL